MSTAIRIRQDVYRGWNAWWVDRGPLTLVLVPQVGGRIMGKFWRGRDLAFVNDALTGAIEDLTNVEDIRAHKRELGFLLWGGDKTWLAPQSCWTQELPFLDLDSGGYQLDVEQAEPDRVTLSMTSPVCRETGVQLTRTLTVSADTPGCSLTHGLHNRHEETVEWALWDVDMVLRPAKVFLPIRQESPYPDGVKTYHNEGDSTTVRDRVVSRLGSLAVVDCTGNAKFKFGVDADLGAMLAIFDAGDLGLIGYRKQVPTYHPRPYGHGCVAEVFNAALYDYLELELHGPLVRLRPGESFELTEHCELFDIPRWPASEEEARGYLAGVRRGCA
jgi:hypothetical protein